MPKLVLNLLGGLEVRLGDTALRFPTRHTGLLLAWLTLSPERAHLRETVAGLLWSDRTDQQARTSLRQVILHLRSQLAGADPFPLEITPRSIRLAKPSIDCDLHVLEAAGSHDPVQLAHAVGRVRGELLEGVEIQEPELQTWLLGERARARAIAVDRLRQLSALEIASRRFDLVEVLARRQLTLDPYDEEAVRQLMTAAALQGRRNAALAAFHAYADQLRKELSVSPGPETLGLWQAIRTGRLQADVSGRSAIELGPGKASKHVDRDGSAPHGYAQQARGAQPQSPTATDGLERRHAAVLHVPLLRTAAPEGEWDAETTTEIGRAFGRQAEEILRGHGGQLVHSPSTEIVAVFTEAEHPALLATRAAVDVQAATGLTGAVHAGAIVVGSKVDPGLVGLVARRLAEAGNRVVVSEPVRLECEGYLEFEPGPGIPFPGKGRLLKTWTPLQATGARNRWQAGLRRGLVPLTGRAEELAMLRQALARARQESNVVLIRGEPGIGKSRLVHEFQLSLGIPDHRILEATAAAYQTEAPHSVLGLLVKAWAGHADNSSLADLWAKVSDKLTRVGAESHFDPAICSLLDLPVEDEAWSKLSDAHRHRRTAAALLAMFEIEARERPLVAIIEDAHWLDSDTSQILNFLVGGMGGANVLLIVTARPEFQPSWAHQGVVSDVRLRPLNSEETKRLLEHLTGSRALPGGLGERLHARTGGVPFFLEEIIRDLGELGGTREADALNGLLSDDSKVPISVRTALTSRMDRLPADYRYVLQTAAVLGMSVPRSLLASLDLFPEERLHEALDGLCATEFLRRVRTYPEPEYVFVHALTQEVAYQTLLQSHRQNLHRRVLHALEVLRAKNADPRVEDLERHARLGEAWENAARYATSAAERAVAHSGYGQARRYYERALDALSRLPSDNSVRRQMVRIHLKLRGILMVTDHSMVHETLQRAEDLALPLSEPRLLVEIRTHLAFFHATEGRFDEGLEAVERATPETQALADPLLAAELDLAKGQLLRMRGHYRGAVAALSPLLAVWSGPHRLHRGVNVGTRPVFARGHLATCYAHLGDWAAAQTVLSEARALAHEAQRPVDLQFVALQEGLLAALDGNVTRSISRFEQALEIVRVAGLTAFETWIIISLSEALLEMGDIERARLLLRDLAKRPPHGIAEQFRVLAEATQGKVRLMLGDLVGAEETLRGVLAYARRVGHWQLEPLALRRLARALAPRDAAQAKRLLEDAVASALRGEQRVELAKSVGAGNLPARSARVLA